MCVDVFGHRSNCYYKTFTTKVGLLRMEIPETNLKAALRGHQARKGGVNIPSMKTRWSLGTLLERYCWGTAPGIVMALPPT